MKQNIKGTIKGIRNMVQTTSAVALSDKVITRANIIAERTGSLEIGIVKAMMLEQLINYNSY